MPIQNHCGVQTTLPFSWLKQGIPKEKHRPGEVGSGPLGALCFPLIVVQRTGADGSRLERSSGLTLDRLPPENSMARPRVPFFDPPGSVLTPREIQPHQPTICLNCLTEKPIAPSALAVCWGLSCSAWPAGLTIRYFWWMWFGTTA